MKRLCLVVSSLLLFGLSYAQSSGVEPVRAATHTLNEALLGADTAKLRVLLHDSVSYGHSNGWVERKHDMLRNLASAKLRYHKVAQEITQVTSLGDMSLVRSQGLFVVSLDGQEIALKLHVLQIWMRELGKWRLVARQSTKL